MNNNNDFREKKKLYKDLKRLFDEVSDEQRLFFKKATSIQIKKSKCNNHQRPK